MQPTVSDIQSRVTDRNSKECRYKSSVTNPTSKLGETLQNDTKPITPNKWTTGDAVAVCIHTTRCVSSVQHSSNVMWRWWGTTFALLCFILCPRAPACQFSPYHRLLKECPMLPVHRYNDTALYFVVCVLGNGNIDNYAFTGRKYSQNVTY
jgi:hypothetical protein